jgi:hypothetical protein
MIVVLASFHHSKSFHLCCINTIYIERAFVFRGLTHAAYIPSPRPFSNTMKSLHERRRNSVYMRVSAGTILAIIVWTIFGFFSVCSPDDPSCALALPSPHFENDWMAEPMALVAEEPMVIAKGEVVEKASLGHQRPTQSVYFSTPPAVEEVVERPQPAQESEETTFLAHAPGYSVIETGKLHSFPVHP